MRKNLMITFGCVLELTGAAIIIFTRFANPDLTEMRLFLNCWPIFGISLLLIFIGMALAGAWRE